MAAPEITSNSLKHGSQSVGTSAVQLTATSQFMSRGVQIKAAAGNSGTVYVGASSSVTAGTSTAATDGYPLAAGEEVFIEITSPSLLYVIASASSQAVSWCGVGV